MVKLYQRYAPRAAFGVVSSGPAIFDWSGKLCLTAALEGVNIWNLRKLNIVREPSLALLVLQLLSSSHMLPRLRLAEDSAKKASCTI